MLNLLAKGSEHHCRHQLGKTLDEHAARRARDHRDLPSGRGLTVNLYLEDWSNGYRDNPDYVYGMVDRWPTAGIGHFMLPDTLGVMTPDQVFAPPSSTWALASPGCGFDFHPHNDYGLGTANVLAAAQAGAAAVHCTVNCLGERAGNASLAEVVVNLQDQLGLTLGIDETHIVRLSEMVEYFSGKRIADNAPLSGPMSSPRPAASTPTATRRATCTRPTSPERFARRRKYALGKLAARPLWPRTWRGSTSPCRRRTRARC